MDVRLPLSERVAAVENVGDESSKSSLLVQTPEVGHG
jgi:hypothetical protein